MGGAGFSWWRRVSCEGTATAGRRRSSRWRTGAVSPDRRDASPAAAESATGIVGRRLRAGAARIQRHEAAYVDVPARRRGAPGLGLALPVLGHVPVFRGVVVVRRHVAARPEIGNTPCRERVGPEG